MRNILREKKLDKKNKLVLVEKDGLFVVISLRKTFFLGWRRSEYGMEYQTDLVGQKIVDGKYQGFSLESNAIKWMNFLVGKYSTRIKFIGS